MKYLRGVMGITKRDRIRNDQIREHLKVQSLLDFIETRQVAWWGHLIRMNADRQVRRVWEAKAGEVKRRGRPRNTWDSNMGEILRKKGSSWTEAKVLARDKKQWQHFVHG